MSIEKLSASKRFEIHFLESVQAPGLVSCISMELYPNSSKIKEQSLNPGFHNSLLPYLVYHTQLLLEEYTKLNAFYLEDCIHYHENIYIGIAIDNGKGLRVIYLNTKKSDSIIDIQKAIVKASIDYDNDKLANDQLTKSTFTITDLSNFKFVLRIFNLNAPLIVFLLIF